MDYTQELERIAHSPEAVRFAAEAAAADEGLNGMIGKIAMSADFAAFLASAAADAEKVAKWRQQEQRLSFPLRGGRRLPKRTIVRPEVTRRIGYLAPR